MKHMKRIICVLAIMTFALGAMALTIEAAQGASPQSKCPVQGGNINKDLFVDYNGKRIYFCCDGCPQEFRKDPAKYMKKLEEQGVTLEAAPAN